MGSWNRHIVFVLLLLMMPASRAVGQVTLPSDAETPTTMRGTYYSDRFVGRKTSSGEVFSQTKFTAAHYSYKFGTLLLVTNPKNGRQVIVRVNDRCPKSNVLDMSRRAAKHLGISAFPVEVQILPEEYYPYWEAQEVLLDVLAEGKFLEFAKSNPAPKTDDIHPENVDPVIHKKTNDNKSVKLAEESGIQYYDIELCRIKSKSAIRGQLSQLPIYYQDRVEYKTVKGANGLIVMLSVSTTKELAEKIKEEIKPCFPSAKVVKIK